MSTTTKAAHTPGPWTFSAFSFGSPTAPVCHKKIVGPMEDGVSQKLIAEIHMQHDTHEADGALIAAAPEMLEALEACVTHGYYGSQDKVLAAIQKARGEK